jgi:hypothetical protein
MKNIPISRGSFARSAASAGTTISTRTQASIQADSGLVSLTQLYADIERGYQYFWRKRAMNGVFLKQSAQGF